MIISYKSYKYSSLKLIDDTKKDKNTCKIKNDMKIFKNMTILNFQKLK